MGYIRHIIVDLVLFLILGFTACDDTTAEFGSIIELKEGDTVVMPDKTVVSLAEINDSRCPAGANCVWEGRADVTLKVTLSATEQKVELNEAEKVSVTFDNYKFEFIELTPLPDFNTSTSGTLLKVKVSLNQ